MVTINTNKNLTNQNQSNYSQQVTKPLKNKGVFSQKLKREMEQFDKLNKSTKPQIESGTDIAYKNIAAEFEKSFEAFMYNLQFKTVEVDSLTGGGIGEEVFRSELIDALIQKRRENNPGQIADAIYNKMKSDDPTNNNKTKVSGGNAN